MPYKFVSDSFHTGVRLRRYERKYIENRRFRTNAVTLIQNFRYKGSSPPIIFIWIVRPMNTLQLCFWQFSHSCYGWGATSKNRSKIGDFAPTRSLWYKISGKRGRPPPIIFARLVRPMNALQHWSWQFSHKETL